MVTTRQCPRGGRERFLTGDKRAAEENGKGTVETTATDNDVVRLILLRHGQVASHRGDVPLTSAGVAQATAAGNWFAERGHAISMLLHGGTARARETAEHFRTAFESASNGPRGAVELDASVALRNPDLYLGGYRVNMVSSSEALAEQVPPLTAADIAGSSWFTEFLTSADRVGFWVGHTDPPGETARAVAQRIEAFTRSLRDVPGWRGGTVVGTTHSPILRAVAHSFHGADPGEPPFLHGYSLTADAAGAVHVEKVAPEIATAVMTN